MPHSPDILPECKVRFKDIKDRNNKQTAAIIDIKDNHLTHIQQSVTAIETHIHWLKWIALSVGGSALLLWFSKLYVL